MNELQIIDWAICTLAAIPESQFCKHTADDGKGRHCSSGHLMKAETGQAWQSQYKPLKKEVIADLFKEYFGSYLCEINDESDNPKTGVLAKLKELKIKLKQT